MFYALIVICALTATVCDVEHAVTADQSPPMFRSADECFAAARARLPHLPIPGFREGDSVQINIACEPVGEAI